MSYSSACKFWHRGKFVAIMIARVRFLNPVVKGAVVVVKVYVASTIIITRRTDKGPQIPIRADVYCIDTPAIFPQYPWRNPHKWETRSSPTSVSVFAVRACNGWKTTEIKLLDENIIFVLKTCHIHMSSSLLRWRSTSKKSALFVWNRTRDIHLSVEECSTFMAYYQKKFEKFQIHRFLTVKCYFRGIGTTFRCDFDAYVPH